MIDYTDDLTTLLILFVMSGILSREVASEIYAESNTTYADDEEPTSIY